MRSEREKVRTGLVPCDARRRCFPGRAGALAAGFLLPVVLLVLASSHARGDEAGDEATRAGEPFVNAVSHGETTAASGAVDGGPPPAAQDGRDRAREGFTWRWYWDQGVRYDLEVPFDEYWVGPDRAPLSGYEIQQRLAFVGRIGGIIQVDAAAYDESRGLDGAESGVELRRFRFGTRGDFYVLGHVAYAFDLELVSQDLQVGDAYLWWDGVPLVRTLKVGNFTPPLSLESVTAARDTVFMENSLPVQAFAPGRSAGIQLGGSELSQRLEWTLGAFRTLETPTVGDQSKAGARLTGRVTGLVQDDVAARQLTHVGLSGSFLLAAEDVRYRSRPESHIAPTFVDTGVLRSADNSVIAGLELAHVRGPWLGTGEVLLASVRGDGDETLWGGYASLSRFLADVTQPYNRSTGTLGRFETPRPFSLAARRFGTLRVAGRVSYLDLSDGRVAGGRETNLTADLTWFLNHYLSIDVEYGFAAVRDRPDGGNLSFVQTRLQIDFF